MFLQLKSHREEIIASSFPFSTQLKTSCEFADPVFRTQFEYKKKLMDIRTQQHFVEVCCNLISVNQALGSFDNKGIKQKWNLIAEGTRDENCI